ncbi:MAG: hypothetical protein JO104_05045 [Candidatus Eremiobacteraeota bacterium]|nr:hypothetical protein [Candidatus Eremiobacteraeota bacterium]
MRRVVGIGAAVALVLALSFAVARAVGLPVAAGTSDLGSQLMLRLFGETSDSSASFAAARGDRASESPLRDLALQIGPNDGVASFMPGLASVFQPEQLTLRDFFAAGAFFGAPDGPPAEHGVAHFSALSAQREDLVALVPSNALFTAAYQPVAPAPTVSPEPGALAFAAPANSVGVADSLPAETRSTVFVPRAMQVGPVHFEGHVEGAATQTPALSLRDDSYGAGANFNVRAGRRNINLDLTSEYEQVARNDVNNFSASTLGSASWQLPGGGPLVVPNYADLNRLSVGAGLAVPVIRGLTLHLNYNAQHLYGGYGLPGLMNLDTVNNSYGGQLTFNIPSTSGSLSISAYQDRFGDSLLPINGTTQMREDVNFTVKF